MYRCTSIKHHVKLQVLRLIIVHILLQSLDHRAGNCTVWVPFPLHLRSKALCKGSKDGPAVAHAKHVFDGSPEQWTNEILIIYLLVRVHSL